MKKDKEKNGHVFNYNGVWYNFCIKCSAPSHARYGCFINFSYKQISSIENIEDYLHDINPDTFECKKCNCVFFNTQTMNTLDNIPFVYYKEQKEDRVTNRFYTTKFNSDDKFPLICMYSKDDATIKDIIL